MPRSRNSSGGGGPFPFTLGCSQPTVGGAIAASLVAQTSQQKCSVSGSRPCDYFPNGVQYSNPGFEDSPTRRSGDRVLGWRIQGSLGPN